MTKLKFIIGNMLIMFSFMAITTTTLYAQVTIGLSESPVSGALLQLKQNDSNSVNASKGLGMPRVSLLALTTDDSDLKVTISGATGETWSRTSHIGLIIYNTNKIETKSNRVCPGLHVWDGDAWQPLVPYPAIETQRTLQSRTNRNFEYLDSSSPASSWPDGKPAVDYPLGPLGTFADNRPNDASQEYTYTRFYVGYKTHESVYSVKRSYSCDSSAPVWVNEDSETETTRTFQDGVWMTSNLRAITMPDGTAIPQSASTESTPSYAYPNNQASNRAAFGVLYNFTATMNIGTAAGQTPEPGDVNQGGSDTSADVYIQGVCPQGWHVPSDQDWTDLENGIILKTSTFSTTPDMGETSKLGYNVTAWWGGPLGDAMKSTTKVSTQTFTATSKTAADGGFDALLLGTTSSSGTISGYGGVCYLWSASNVSTSTAWMRSVAGSVNMIYRNDRGRADHYCVRCIRD